MDLKSHWPTILTLLGGALTIIGVAWASVRNSETQKELQTISINALNQITGGDSWCYIEGGLKACEGGIWRGQPVLLSFVFKGTIPMYDVSVVVHKSVPNGLMREPFFEKKIGTLTNIMLSNHLGTLTLPDNERVDYLIEINSRNGQIIQHLVFVKRDEKVWLTGTRVLRWKAIESHTYRYEELYKYEAPGFPEEPKFINS